MTQLTIFVDADACPGPIKEILFRASQRLELPVRLVANRTLQVPAGGRIQSICVPQGFDEADRYIAEHVAARDLVITGDIPLAAQVIAKGARVLNTHGEELTTQNIGERLAVRNYLDDLRASGPVSGGPAPFNNQDKHRFAAALDRLLHLLMRSS